MLVSFNRTDSAAATLGFLPCSGLASSSSRTNATSTPPGCSLGGGLLISEQFGPMLISWKRNRCVTRDMYISIQRLTFPCKPEMYKSVAFTLVLNMQYCGRRVAAVECRRRHPDCGAPDAVASDAGGRRRAGARRRAAPLGPARACRGGRRRRGCGQKGLSRSSLPY